MIDGIDLASLQRQRDAEIRAGRALVAERIGDLADRVLSWAGRADRARLRLSGDDAEASFSVERWCARRLKSDVRRVLGKTVAASVKADTVNLCELAFEDRLRALQGIADEVAK